MLPTGPEGAPSAELAAARRDAARLVAENERLMELSNALRAGRDRAARAAAAAAAERPALPARHLYPPLGQPLLPAAPVHYVLAPQLLGQQQQPLYPPAAAAAAEAVPAKSAAGHAGKENDDVAQRLQRIEALAEEIAHAQVLLCSLHAPCHCLGQAGAVGTCRVCRLVSAAQRRKCRRKASVMTRLLSVSMLRR